MPRVELGHDSYSTPYTNDEILERLATGLFQSCSNNYNFAVYQKPMLLEIYSFNSILLMLQNIIHKEHAQLTKENRI